MKKHEKPVKEAKPIGIKLGLLERIVLPGFFPNEASIADLIIKKDIIKKIALTQIDVIDFEIKNTEDGRGTTWNNAGINHVINVVFTPLERALINKTLKNVLKEKNDTEKVTEQLLFICDNFGVKF